MSRLLGPIGALMLLVLAAAPGAAGAQREPTRFTGRCDLHGVVRYSPAMTGAPQEIRMSVRARGSCSGDLARGARTQTVDGSPATVRVESTGTTSCEVSRQSGSGIVRIAGRKIAFAFFEPRGGPIATPVLTGRAGGVANVVARPSASEDPAAIAAACAGSGVRTVGIDASLSTSPFIAG